MIEYAFETITPEQALNIQAGDTLTINGGPASGVKVAYHFFDPPKPGEVVAAVMPWIEVTFGGRSVNFAPELTRLSDVGAVVMADGSTLFVGDAGPERLAVRGATDDGLYGGPGDDTLDGGAGDDLIQGNSGHDVLVGGEGADAVFGGQGDDVIHPSADGVGVAGEAGDFAHGNMGNDEIAGGGGDDTLLGGQGNDFIGGRDGDDFISGDMGDDELHGGQGDDTLVGGVGHDTLNGGFGADRLSGGDGDDVIYAQGLQGNTVDGGSGNDTIVAASAGQDQIWGGAGRDSFTFVANTAPEDGFDVIHDWEAHDTLSFAGVSIFGTAAILPREYSEFVAASYDEALRIANEHISGGGAVWVAAQVGNDVVVFADVGDPADGADTAVLLVGRTLADIDLGNFG